MPTSAAIYLASASPRRAELLRQIGVTFSVVSAPVDETRQAGESPADYVCRVAREKAQAGWQHPDRQADRPVLAADTSVVLVDNLLGDTVLGKPQHEAEGLAMLAQLSGRRHQVLTAVCIKRGAHEACELSVSTIGFRPMSPAEQRAYWQSGEGRDKAGGYAVQGLAARYIDYLEGSYSGVVGLPLHVVDALLQRPEFI